MADFSGTPLSGTAPLTVAFTDASTNTPTSWAWDFGDAGTSTSQNPSHQYVAAGAYTVQLTATNAGGSDPETKNNYITVTPVVVAGATAPARGNAGAFFAKHDRHQTAKDKKRTRGEFEVEITAAQLIRLVASHHLDSDTDTMISDAMQEFEDRFMRWDTTYIGDLINERDQLIAERAERLRKEEEARKAWLKRRELQERNKKI